MLWIPSPEVRKSCVLFVMFEEGQVLGDYKNAGANIGVSVSEAEHFTYVN
jgi:N-acetylglucosamine kinase-like BadF-type ATPase